MYAMTVSISPPASYPPTPPNTEARSRANSLMSVASSRTPSEHSAQTPSSILVNGYGPRRVGPPRNLGQVNFAHVLTQVQNDTPGRFYESSVDVPNNTPCCSSAAPDSPRSAFTDNLVVIDELLEELPGPYASKPSSPAPSVFGTSTSASSEPLTMAIRPRLLPTVEASPLSTTDNIDDGSTASSATSFDSTNTDTATERAGIYEFTDWAGDIEADVQRNLARLGNLANDDFLRSQELTAEEHYRRRLARLVNDKSLSFIYGDISNAPMPAPEANPPAGTPKKLGGTTPPVQSPAYNINPQEFHEIAHRVACQGSSLTLVHGELSHANYNVNKLSKKFENNLSEHEAELKKLRKENDRMKDDLALMKKLLLKGSESTTKLGDDAEGSSKKA